MTDEQLIARTHKAFTAAFGRQVAFNVGLSRVNETRWTSLKHVEFILCLEREFDVRFDGADATDITSVAVVLECLRQKLA
jgi:hypothetical protein